MSRNALEAAALGGIGCRLDEARGVADRSGGVLIVLFRREFAQASVWVGGGGAAARFVVGRVKQRVKLKKCNKKIGGPRGVAARMP